MPALWRRYYDICYNIYGKLGVDVNNKDSDDGSTALMGAVWRGENSIVKHLLDQPGVRINEKNLYGLTALHYAAGGNNPEGARMLLFHPDMNSANSRNNKGETAVIFSLRLSNKEVLHELVNHKSVSLDLREGDLVWW